MNDCAAECGAVVTCFSDAPAQAKIIEKDFVVSP
jgi:hypothetical protein